MTETIEALTRLLANIKGQAAELDTYRSLVDDASVESLQQAALIAALERLVEAHDNLGESGMNNDDEWKELDEARRAAEAARAAGSCG